MVLSYNRRIAGSGLQCQVKWKGASLGKQYLVKWKGLGYEDCSWESSADLLPKFHTEIQRFQDQHPIADELAERRKSHSQVRQAVLAILCHDNLFCQALAMQHQCPIFASLPSLRCLQTRPPADQGLHGTRMGSGSCSYEKFLDIKLASK